jgi:hypothetical protein
MYRNRRGESAFTPAAVSRMNGESAFVGSPFDFLRIPTVSPTLFSLLTLGRDRGDSYSAWQNSLPCLVASTDFTYIESVL